MLSFCLSFFSSLLFFKLLHFIPSRIFKTKFQASMHKHAQIPWTKKQNNIWRIFSNVSSLILAIPVGHIILKYFSLGFNPYSRPGPAPQFESRSESLTWLHLRLPTVSPYNKPTSHQRSLPPSALQPWKQTMASPSGSVTSTTPNPELSPLPSSWTFSKTASVYCYLGIELCCDDDTNCCSISCIASNLIELVIFDNESYMNEVPQHCKKVWCALQVDSYHRQYEEGQTDQNMYLCLNAHASCIWQNLDGNMEYAVPLLTPEPWSPPFHLFARKRPGNH